MLNTTPLYITITFTICKRLLHTETASSAPSAATVEVGTWSRQTSYMLVCIYSCLWHLFDTSEQFSQHNFPFRRDLSAEWAQLRIKFSRTVFSHRKRSKIDILTTTLRWRRCRFISVQTQRTHTHTFDCISLQTLHVTPIMNGLRCSYCLMSTSSETHTHSSRTQRPKHHQFLVLPKFRLFGSYSSPASYAQKHTHIVLDVCLHWWHRDTL